MPVITNEGSKLTNYQREALFKEFTEATCRIIPNVTKQSYYVFIRDHPDENLGVEGVFLKDYIAELQRNNNHEK